MYYLERFDRSLWSAGHSWNRFYAPSTFTLSTANELAAEFNARGIRCVVRKQPDISVDE